MHVGLWVKRVLAMGVAAVVAGALLQLQPAPAEPVALAATGEVPPSGSPPESLAVPDDGVVITQDRTAIRFAPPGREPAGALVFYPGGLVDPRAYAALLRPVAAAGFLVIVPKMPFDLAITDISAADDYIDAEPDISDWFVGGHSLGAAASTEFVAANPAALAGLLLWAGYPIGDLSDVEGVKVLSISGTEDGLTTPADVEASAANLPPDTRFVAIDGAVHSHFGDYGEQAGDGTPTVGRDEAQAKIVRTTIRWLRATTGR